MEFVCTPSFTALEAAARGCTSRLLVSSPFVGSVLLRLTEQVPSGVAKTVLTRTDLREFATGSSDFETLCQLASGDVRVLSMRRLHAKVYIIDRKFALVTSANATNGGMFRNLELGVCLNDEESVESLAQLLLSGFGATSRPELWTDVELERLRAPIQILRERMPRIGRDPDMDFTTLPVVSVGLTASDEILSAFTGWTRLTLQGVLAQPAEVLSLDDLHRTCLPVVAREYPRNRHVRPQIRKQLQRLRDLGLVEFLGEGIYRRTVQS